MNPQKKRSSLRPPAMEDTPGARRKQRISFSGKKSVRTFSSEECWDNSCEVSDHSADGGAAATSVGVTSNLQESTTKTVLNDRAADAVTGQQKPNISRPATLPPAIAATSDKENFPCDWRHSNVSANTTTNISALYSTHEFINKTQRLSSEYEIERSVDFTLLDRDCVYKSKDNTQLNKDVSFFLEECDFERLQQRTKPQLERDAYLELKSVKNKSSRSENEQPKLLQHTILQVRDMTLASSHIAQGIKSSDGTRWLDECMDESMFPEDSYKLSAANDVAPITIFIDETIVAEGNQSEVHSLKRTTLCREETIKTDESAEFEKEFCGFLQTTIATPLRSAAKAVAMVKETLATSTPALPNDFSQPIQSVIEAPVQQPAASSLVPDSALKRPKVIVRKICTPQVHKPLQAVDDLEKKRFLRYQNKQQQAELNQEPIAQSTTPPALQTINKSKNTDISIFDHSPLPQHFSNSNSEFSSPELSSPLLPTEYLQRGGSKKLNFRQLNHDIEHGKIQIFSDTPKPPLAKQRQFPGFSASKADHKTSDNSFCLQSEGQCRKSKNTFPNLAEVESLLPTNEQKLRSTNFSLNDADDMLLDNTSFLTKAKLGDETISRNSSKVSSSHGRETMHFNSEIELTKPTLQYDRTIHDSVAIPNENVPSEKKPNNIKKNRQTLHFCDAIELENKPNNKNEISIKPRQTLYCSDDIELETENHLVMKTNPDKVFNHGQTHYFDDNLELEQGTDNDMQTVSNDIRQNVLTKKRETLHFTDDIELDGNTNKKAIASRPSQTLNFFENIEMETENSGLNKPKRLTVFIDNQMDCSSLPSNEKKESNMCKQRETLYFSDDIDLEEKTNNRKRIDIKPRQTVYCSDDIELEAHENSVMKTNHDNQKPKVSNHRQTLYFDEKLELEPCSDNDKKTLSSTRQTLYNDEDKPNVVAKKLETLHFTDDIVFDGNTNNKSIASKPSQTLHCFENIEMETENAGLNKPKRLTVFIDNQMDCSSLPSNEKKESNKCKQRETLYFSDDIDLEEKTNNRKRIDVKPRQTVYCSDDIELEADENIVMKTNLDNQKPKVSIHRQTLYFDDKLELEQCSDNDKQTLSSTRQTLHFDEDKQNVLTKKLETLYFPDDIELDQNTNKKPIASKPRQTLYYSDDIELEKPNASKIPTTKHDISKPNLYQPRHTRHFGEEINLEQNDTNKNISTKKHETLQLSVNTELDRNTNKQLIVSKPNKTLNCTVDIESEEANGNATGTKHDISNPQISNPRRALHYPEDIDLKEEIFSTKPIVKKDKQIVINSRQSQHLKTITDGEMDLSLPPTENILPQIHLHKTQHFENANDMSLDDIQSRLSHLRAAGARKTPTKSPFRYLNKIRAGNFRCQKKTPSPNKELHRLYEGTPHRSIIEFELYERECEQDEKNAAVKQRDAVKELQLPHASSRNYEEFGRQSKVLDVSGVTRLDNSHYNNANSTAIVERLVTATNKRSTANITPNLPHSKKRQTVVFPDCDLEESIVQLSKTDNNEYASHYNNANSTAIVERLVAATNKRSTANITPNLPQSKKRQTVVFPDCDLEESIVQLSKMVVNSKKQRETQFSAVDINIDGTCNDYGVEALELFDDDSVIVCPESQSPVRTTAKIEPVSDKKETHLSRPSHIPVHPNSELENNSILARLSSPLRLDDDDADKSQLSYTVGTIEIPRAMIVAANARQSRSIPKLPLGSKAKSAFEDSPITISDVSTHYLSQRKSACSRFQPEIKPFADLTLCNTVNLNLTRNSLPEMDDIEKTRMDLVETLLDSDTEIDKDEEEIVEEVLPAPNRVLADAHTVSQIPLAVRNTKNVSTTCRKCKRCNETFLNDTTSSTADSFVLPAAPPLPDIGLERLKRLRKRPTLADVHNYYKRLEQAQEFSIDDLFTPDGKVKPLPIDNDDDDEEEDAVDILVADFKKELHRREREITERLEQEAANLQREYFEDRLDRLTRELLPDWLLDYQRMNILQFNYIDMMAFCVAISYEDKAGLGLDIDIKSVELWRNRMPEKNWKTLDFMLHFQLQIELSFDLKSWCGGNSETDVIEMMKKIDKVFGRIVEMGCQLMELIQSQQASLIRNANRNYVQKITRKLITPENSYERVEKCEFRIEIMNLKKVCFKDIVAPPLHLFREEIQHLPTGLDFLIVFLKDPCSYLKN